MIETRRLKNVVIFVQNYKRICNEAITGCVLKDCGLQLLFDLGLLKQR